MLEVGRGTGVGVGTWLISLVGGNDCRYTGDRT